jgi:hypothetical protein
MTRTYLDSGVLIEAVRLQAAMPEPLAEVLADPERVFVSSVFVRLDTNSG